MKKIFGLLVISALLLSCTFPNKEDDNPVQDINAEITLTATARPTFEEGFTGVMLRWSVRIISGTIDGYRIERSRSGLFDDAIRVADVAGDEREFHVGSLTYGNTYTFRLTPFNLFGNGESFRTSFRTTSSLAEQPVIYAEALSSSSIRVIWEADFSNSDSLVVISVKGGDTEFQREISGKNEHIFTELRRDSEYSFRVAVKDRDGFVGAFSDVAVATTKPLAAPQNPLVMISFDEQKIAMCWGAVEGAAAYMVFWDASRTGNFVNQAISEATTDICVEIDDFIPDGRGVEIFFKVAAITGDGRMGELSEIARGDTHWSPPAK